MTSRTVTQGALAEHESSVDTGQPELLGRLEELARLDALLNRARDGQAGVLVLRGEAGIGKSTLLEEGARNAGDFSVCRAVGVESEMELAYGGLQQLCGPLMGRLGDLSNLHRAVLDQVFGVSVGPPPERFLVGMAALDLVATVAQERPLLWLIDDAQWLDQASMQAIAFVGRRLLAERIVILVGARDTSEDNDLAGLPEIRIGGLDTDDAGRLFDSVVSGPTDQFVRDRIIAETRGNPLALLELPRAWTTAELVEGLSESARVPLLSQLEVAFAKRLSELPADTQMLLALAAAEPTGDPALLWSAAQELGLDWSAAAPAERAGLFEVGRRVCFRHPLVRAAAYRSTPLEKRLEVHRVLAEVADPVRDPDRRAWHRACSTVAHDEAIAVELERSADRAKARGGLQAAAALLERAALLTPGGERRANRTLAAAKAKRDAGSLESALRLLSIVETEPPTDLRSALTDQLRGKIAFDQRRGAQAAELLLSAAQRLAPSAPRIAREMHLEALSAALWASGPGGQELVVKAAEAARATPYREEPPRTVDLLVDALSSRVTDGYAVAAPALTAALDAVLHHDLGTEDVDGLLWLAGNRAAGIIAIEAWDYEAGLAFADRQVRFARDAGALVQLQFALNFLANNVVLTGDLRTATALAEEERLLSTMTRVAPVGWSSLLIGAFRGDAKRALPAIHSTIESATNDGQGRIVSFARYVGAVLYNGLGRYADALDCAKQVVEWDALGYQTLVAGEVAEAAAREGDVDLLAYMSEWIQVRAKATPTNWALGIAARIRALAADDADADADACYQESIDYLSHTALRVELARSQLLYGEWLRRRGQRGDARDQISIAYHSLTDMGISAFAERARRELSATTGRRTRKNLDDPSVQLTGQELQISQLAQKGLSNREIGARLFLSPRTVEWHLRNVFGKVGATSRRQLRDTNLDPFRPNDPAAGDHHLSA